MTEDAGFSTRIVTSHDGLKLFGREYGPRHATACPVVCLAGLTRNSADFHELALFLSQQTDTPRRVLALDYRGRGESDVDSNWRNYDPRIEAQDVLAFLAAAGVHEAIFVGTSRGGLVTYALAILRPALLRAVVLNDIGAAVDARGLIRIRSYVGKLPPPRTWDQAADILRTISDAQFTAATPEEWERNARRTWREEKGRLVPRYDLALMKGLALLDLEKPLPDLWPYFMGLRHVPTLVVRGANSDLLSAATVEEMTRRHPDCAAIAVPDQGHAPMLADAPTLAAIEAFMTRADGARRQAA